MNHDSFERVREERTAVILAGGRSSRFGSNKALQVLAGKPLIHHVVERVSSVTGQVIVVLGRDENNVTYRNFLPGSVRIVNDCLEGKNPLVGIVSGLSATESDYAAVLACDAPFVNEKVIEHLFRRASNADAAIPKWNGQRIEPLQAVYRRISTLKVASETLAPTDLSLEDMIAKLAQVVYVSVEEEIARIDRGLSTFFNINTREDMKAAEKMLAEKGLHGEDSGVERSS
jgi:molybdopterin-guanine dinucleotide biosynthesis protein A